MTSEYIILYFKQGSSDKVYNVSLEEVEGKKRFVVNFAYGRQGATLTTGTKTKTPLDYDSAKKIYNKLVKSKTSKGYTPGAEGPQYMHTDADTKDTGIHCQLLNFIEEVEAERLINDDVWWAQEKYDGKRMLLRKTDTVTAINRQGLSVGAPDAIITSAGSVDQSYLVDGEAVGETLFVFDLLEIDQTDLRSAPYGQRLAQLEIVGFNGAIVVAETAKTPREKQQFYDRLRTSGAEGIVFKQHVAPYTIGRPNSGGTQVKFKFYATASVVVTQINAKRSVGVAVRDGDQPVEVGNVTIPSNHDVPAVNTVIEVRYLYAYEGGSLYQPTYLGPRDDLRVEDCGIAQLKYKKAVEE